MIPEYYHKKQTAVTKALILCFLMILSSLAVAITPESQLTEDSTLEGQTLTFQTSNTSYLSESTGAGSNSSLGWGGVNTIPQIYGGWESVVVDEGGNLTALYQSSTTFAFNGTTYAPSSTTCYAFSFHRNSSLRYVFTATFDGCSGITVADSYVIITGQMSSNLTFAMNVIDENGTLFNQMYQVRQNNGCSSASTYTAHISSRDILYHPVSGEIWIIFLPSKSNSNCSDQIRWSSLQFYSGDIGIMKYSSISASSVSITKRLGAVDPIMIPYEGSEILFLGDSGLNANGGNGFAFASKYTSSFTSGVTKIAYFASMSTGGGIDDYNQFEMNNSCNIMDMNGVYSDESLYISGSFYNQMGTQLCSFGGSYLPYTSGWSTFFANIDNHNNTALSIDVWRILAGGSGAPVVGQFHVSVDEKVTMLLKPGAGFSVNGTQVFGYAISAPLFLYEFNQTTDIGFTYVEGGSVNGVGFLRQVSNNFVVAFEKGASTTTVGSYFLNPVGTYVIAGLEFDFDSDNIGNSFAM